MRRWGQHRAVSTTLEMAFVSSPAFGAVRHFRALCGCAWPGKRRSFARSTRAREPEHAPKVSGLMIEARHRPRDRNPRYRSDWVRSLRQRRSAMTWLGVRPSPALRRVWGSMGRSSAGVVGGFFLFAIWAIVGRGCRGHCSGARVGLGERLSRSSPLDARSETKLRA